MEEKKKCSLADAITLSRIPIALAMICMEPSSTAFYCLYVLGGLTDVVDGAVARKQQSISQRGERLDSIADLVFFTACAIKILPQVSFPLWQRFWIGIIAVAKIAAYIPWYTKNKELFMLHTVLNKITGVLLFITPALLYITGNYVWSIPACLFATVAVIQEENILKNKQKGCSI